MPFKIPQSARDFFRRSKMRLCRRDSDFSRRQPQGDPVAPTPHEIKGLLKAWSAGDKGATERADTSLRAACLKLESILWGATHYCRTLSARYFTAFWGLDLHFCAKWPVQSRFCGSPAPISPRQQIASAAGTRSNSQESPRYP